MLVWMNIEICYYIRRYFLPYSSQLAHPLNKFWRKTILSRSANWDWQKREKGMAYASDCHWTCSNFYQLDRFDRKDKHNHQSNEYYSNSDREKRENSNRISLPYENRSKINERIFILIFHSTSFERHKEQMRDLSQWNCRCSDLDNLFFFLLLLLLLCFYREGKRANVFV